MQYVLMRIVSIVPVMAIVAFVIFSLLYVVPGDPAAMMAGDYATPETLAAMRSQMGLDQPFLARFVQWVWQIFRCDLGTSITTGLPVVRMIIERVEPTFSLMLLTTILTVGMAVPLGVVAAVMQRSWVDLLVLNAATLGFSVPVFVAGYCLSYVFSVKLGWLPVQGYKSIGSGLWPWLSHLILPCIALSGVFVALISRITRATVLEVLRQDYVRTARAKGAGIARVVIGHTMKNAAIPIVTTIGTGVATLIGGAVVTESVFGIPGIGRLTMDAVLWRDYPVVQGLVLFFSFLYMVINLLVDLSYSLFDPKISY